MKSGIARYQLVANVESWPVTLCGVRKLGRESGSQAELFWLKPFWLKFFKTPLALAERARLLQFFSFCCVSAMPRKGWSIVQVPDGWLKVIRGPQPKSERWPRRQSVAHQTDRREERPLRPPQRPSQDAPRHRQEPMDPDAVMAHARVRVAKLEAAM